MAAEVSQREYTVAELEGQLSGEDEWMIAPPDEPSVPPPSSGDPGRSASSSKRKGRKVKRRLSKQEMASAVPNISSPEETKFAQEAQVVAPSGAPSRRKATSRVVERPKTPTPEHQPAPVESGPASLVVTGKRIRKPKLTHEDFFAFEQDLLPSQHVSVYNPQIIAEAFEKTSSSKRKGKPKKAMIGYDGDDSSDETVVLMQPVDDGPSFPPEITWSSALVCTFPGCTKRCSKKHHLDAHMRTHLGEKPFQCPQPGCEKWYSRLYHLKAHSRSHTGEKPFRCTFPSCKWTFARSDKLARHNLKHTGIKSFECTVCDKKFARADHLSRHLGRQHVHKTLLA